MRGRAACPSSAEGMEVGEEIAARAELEDGDVVVISQKIVSKAEGRVRKLSRSCRAPKRASSPPCSARSRPWSS